MAQYRGRSARSLDGGEVAVPIENAYPLTFALLGLVLASLLSERALRLLPADAKAALVDASARTRSLFLLVTVTFIALLLWRPLIAWLFVGCAYLGLGVRSYFRLRRLALPPKPSCLVLLGNVAAVLGIAVTAAEFALRALK